MLKRRWKLLAGTVILVLATFGARRVPALLRVVETKSSNPEVNTFTMKGGDYR